MNNPNFRDRLNIIRWTEHLEDEMIAERTWEAAQAAYGYLCQRASRMSRIFLVDEIISTMCRV